MSKRGIPIVEENVTKGGCNPPNKSKRRPPAPQGSAGKRPTSEEIVAKCNEVARMFYEGMGYSVRKGTRFDQAEHPQEYCCWLQAAEAYRIITGDDPEDALSDLED